MIEQTDLVVSEWAYTPPADQADKGDTITSQLSLDVMKKRAPTKKGIACRFSCTFVNGNEQVLRYVAEDSYVIDLPDIIDKNEVLTMVRNSYSKFRDKFEFRKLGTILRDSPLMPLDENMINLDAILPLLNFPETL